MGLIQVTAYLRNEEDLSKWKALENKTQFLHDALQEKVEQTPQPKMVNTPEDVKKVFPEARAIPKAPVTTTKPIPTA